MAEGDGALRDRVAETVAQYTGAGAAFASDTTAKTFGSSGHRSDPRSRLFGMNAPNRLLFVVRQPEGTESDSK